MTRSEALAAIRARKPLLHCISNLVTANDCANLALAVGASPIMAQAPQEMADIAVLASAVVLNTGTPRRSQIHCCPAGRCRRQPLRYPGSAGPVGVGGQPLAAGEYPPAFCRKFTPPSCGPTTARPPLYWAFLLLSTAWTA